MTVRGRAAERCLEGMEFPSNALLARYLTGECSADELAELDRWATADPVHQALLDDLRTVWQARRPRQSWNVPAMWGAVQRSMRAERTIRRRPAALFKSRTWSRRIGPAAAAAAVAAVGFVGIQRMHSRDDVHGPPIHEYVTAPGQRAKLQLPDGTKLVLAPASRLRIPRDFGHSVREVVLAGEAFIDVVHDTVRPFRVIAKYAVVQDIGTRFDVRAYPEDSAVGVAVAEGAVALGTANSPPSRVAQGVVLDAGDLGTLDRSGRVTTTRGPAVKDHLGWVDGRLVLTDVPLRDAVVRLGRWYGVDVRSEVPTMASRRITAAFTNERALDALQFIASFLDLTVSQSGNQYTLRPK